MTTLDVVIPSLNAASTVARSLAALRSTNDLPLSIIVCDGGSQDDTLAMAREAGATVVAASTGRGTQLAAGAAAGQAPWLLFLHADSVPGVGWTDAVRRFTADATNVTRAGYFRLHFDSPDRSARRVEHLAAWRSRTLGLPYGDQGLLIARAFYESLGGFRPLPLMEDVDFVRRIGRTNLVPLDADMVTSGRRYERDGWLLRPMRNLSCLALYFAGVPPVTIRRLYGP